MRVIYLHGFASSSQSSKATFLASKLSSYGIPFEAPDLNEPDFSTLTVTRMLTQAGDAIAGGTDAVALVGSSLGGFVAVQAALQNPTRVARVVLLAPALDFGTPANVSLEKWKATNRLDVFHYGYGRVMTVHYELYEDARRYDSFNANVTQPVQVFQGIRDDAVDAAMVTNWCRARANVELHLLDDGHQLLVSLEFIWRKMSRFFGLPELPQLPTSV